MLEAAWLIPAFPLAGFVLLVAFGRRLGEPVAGWLATAGQRRRLRLHPGGLRRPAGGPRERAASSSSTCSPGSPAGAFSVDAGLLVDPLAITMCLFITGVGTLIHLYSIGYMHGDPNYSKFFVYLNLFVFSMLMLVLGDNMLLTFLGWEGVGACSYLLISFWFTVRGQRHAPARRPSSPTASATSASCWPCSCCSHDLGSIRYADILDRGRHPVHLHRHRWPLLLLLLAAAGKSAQLPLYVWLPDAMAGPTPVSALIHAATMVTAGVYLLTRLNPVLAQADT